jgi:hypothetical protein
MTTTTEPLALLSAAVGQDAACSAFYSNSVLSDRGFKIRHLTPGWAGPVVPDELCPELFRTADLILLNFNHDRDRARRHYDPCLELGRAPEKTLLIAHANRPIRFDTPCPILYFRGPMHLLRGLRAHFGMSNPVAPSKCGYSMVFRAPSPFFALSDLLLPQALLSTLRELRFSGRCECCSNARKIFDRPDH